MKDVFRKRNVALSFTKRIFDLCHTLSLKRMTKDGEERKKRIISKVYHKSDSTELQLELYVSVLCIMKEYVCSFQTEAPMIHKLFDQHVSAVKKFLQCFIWPEKLPSDMHRLNLDSQNTSATQAYIHWTAKEICAK